METWVLALELRPRNASRGEEIRMGGTGRMSVYASEVERGGGGGGRREVRGCPGGAGRGGWACTERKCAQTSETLREPVYR